MGAALPGDNGPNQVSKETFPLPLLDKRLEDISKELHFGRGFAILRGLEPKKYTPLDNIIIYAGVTSYIAETRGCQDGWGNMISENSTASVTSEIPNINSSSYKRCRGQYCFI